MKKQSGPLSGGRISGEHVPAEDWQREWGDVPKAITEATVVVKPGQHKPKATATAQPKAPDKQAAKKK